MAVVFMALLARLVANTAQELNPLLNDKMSLCRIRNSFLIKQGKAASCLPVCMS